MRKRAYIPENDLLMEQMLYVPPEKRHREILIRTRFALIDFVSHSLRRRMEDLWQKCDLRV